MILAIRTEKPESFIALIDGEDRKEHSWEAGRQLSNTLLKEIDNLLKSNNKSKADLGGVIVFKGPGSFTGLRIGISTANAIADGLQIPIVGTDEESWLETGIKRLDDAENDKIVLPNYGAEANITKPRK